MNVAKPLSKGDSIRQSLIAKGILRPGTEATKQTMCATASREGGREVFTCSTVFEQLARDTWTICPRCSHPQLHRNEEGA